MGRTYSGGARHLGAAVRLTVVVLVTLVGISHASVPEGAIFARQASLTIPTVPLSDPTAASGSGTASNVSILPIATTTTALTTSIGPNGTSTFLTTVTTLLGPGPSNATTVSGSGNISASATSTSTAYPSLGSYSACVDNCLQLAVSAPNCSSITDTACYCVTSAFTSTLVRCVFEQCKDELSTAENLAQAFCNLSSPSVSLAFPAPSVSSNASGSAGQASEPPSTTGNAAIRLTIWEAKLGLSLWLWSSVVGIIIGALLC